MVEEAADRGEMLPHRARRILAAHLVDVSVYGERGDVGQLKIPVLARCQESHHRLAVSLSRIGAANASEKFQRVPFGFASRPSNDGG